MNFMKENCIENIIAGLRVKVFTHKMNVSLKQPSDTPNFGHKIHFYHPGGPSTSLRGNI